MSPILRGLFLSPNIGRGWYKKNFSCKEIKRKKGNRLAHSFIIDTNSPIFRCIKVSAFMDRGNSSLPQMQLNFIDFLVAPLFSSITDLLPEVKVPLGILAKNRTQWAEILEAEKASIMSEPELIGRDTTDSPKAM
jgi:hypothetical protein